MNGGGRTSNNNPDLRNLSDKELLQRQKDGMKKDFERPLAELESSLSSTMQSARQISQEIANQNRMLEQTNAETERVQSRMGALRRFFDQAMLRNRNRWLWLIIGLLLLALGIILLIVLTKSFNR